MNWTFAVDPIEPEVVYTNAGYGAMGNGLFNLQGSQLLQSPAGTFVVAGADAIRRSLDGTATSWSPIADKGPIVGGLISDGASS